jgi:hypothetical protein
VVRLRAAGVPAAAPLAGLKYDAIDLGGMVWREKTEMNDDC